MEELSVGDVQVPSLQVLCGAANFRLVRAECVGGRSASHGRATRIKSSRELSCDNFSKVLWGPPIALTCLDFLRDTFFSSILSS